jgi:DNA recombination protein RmuC
MIGTILGGAAVAAFMLHRRAKLDAQLANARAKAELLDEHLQIRTKDEDRLKQAFTALGAEALRANNEQFVELAKRTFEAVVVESRGDAERRRQAIESLIKPINALLEKQNSAVAEIEKKREVAYRGLEEQIKAIAASHEKLGTETSRLVAALRRPEQRGRWGEMQLHNAVELAGMTAHCDFTLQPQTDDPTTRDRPDMIVHIPGGGRIIVDAKVALDAYLEALEPGTDHAALVQRHASQVVEHYRHLASKQYWSQFERTPKLVVMSK